MRAATLPPGDEHSQRQFRLQAINGAFAEGQKFFRAGDFDSAARSLSRAAELAARAGDAGLEAKAWLAVSGCRIRLFDYRNAQQAAERCRVVSFKAKNNATAGAATVNLATIYLQLGDYSLAGKEAAYASKLLKDSPDKERLVKALLIYAETEAERIRNNLESTRTYGDSEPAAVDTLQIEQNYRRGIAVAHEAGLSRLEANLWEELGYSLLLAHHPQKAEEPLHKAYVLELMAHDDDGLAVNEAHQAELQLQKGNYRAALELIDRAFASKSPSFKTMPQFYPLHIRGLLLAALNRKKEALAELRNAVSAANEWRQGALPGDATSTQMVVVLHDVYNDYAQFAAELSLESNDSRLAREALEVLAVNRAANLREQIGQALLHNKARLPPRYFDLLQDLQTAQARVTFGAHKEEDTARLRQIRLEIGSLENQFGLDPNPLSRNSEKNSDKNSLRDIQARLSEKEVLLSFSLGPVRSFLWTVTRDRVGLYRLGGQSRISSLARQYLRAVEQKRDVATGSLELSRELFAGLPASIWKKCEWLIVGDGVLLGGLPFASLTDLASSKGDYLIQNHHIRFIPSEFLLLSADKNSVRRRFLGVGDPIYNTADSRDRKTGSSREVPNAASMALARLAGSDRELRDAARESGLPESEILVGRDATVASLQRSVARAPAILHFAVHVVAANGPNQSASFSPQPALALSLTADKMPELLTPEAIAALRVPGSLVILSGCSSQQGRVLPGAGLMGLSRAWLLAGASAVIVSGWPTPDDSGRFFSSFYAHFDAASSGSLAQRAALALQQAQVDMKGSAGYRSAPKFWAAYSIISKE